MDLYLASESPRRRELLSGIIKDFKVEAAAVEEVAAFTAIGTESLTVLNARLKAEAVAARHPGGWVLGADTVVMLDQRILGKPCDIAEAREFLRMLSGREHQVLTGVCLINRDLAQQFEFEARSLVRFRQLDEESITRYLQLVYVLDKAGAYGIQEHGDILVESIDGELENIIGLPVGELAGLFRKVGILPAAANGE